MGVGWITMVLQTIIPKHQDLRHVSISMLHHLLPDIRPGVWIEQTVGEETFRQWSGLDRLLIQLWESCSIRPRVECWMLGEGEESTRYPIVCLLPAVAR